MTEPHPSIRLSDIRKGERYRRDLGDIDALAASIASVGLLHPIVVTSGDVLVAGERRLAAVSKLGWSRVPCRVIDPTDLLTAERDENAQRLPFSPSEAAAIAKALEPVERAAAKDRQGTRTDIGAGLPARTARSRDRIAAAVGMGRTTLAKAAEVVQAADEGLIPDAVVHEMDRTGNVSAAHRETQRLLATTSEALERTDPKVAESARQARFSRAISAHGHARMRLEPADWADGMTEADVAAMRAHLVGVREWIKRWDAALDRPALRVVGGAG